MIVLEERKICRMLEGLFQFDKECEWNDAIEEAMHRFVNLPTIEAEPVRHGKWDTFFSDSYKVHEIGVECSCCGYRTQERTTYCPNCGAKMDGERRTDETD